MGARQIPFDQTVTPSRQTQPEIGYALVPSAVLPMPGKHAFDMIAGLLLFAAFSPLLAVIAAAIAATQSGPVIFRQQRVGAGGRMFWLYKFRTMRHAPHSAFVQARPDDPRVTRLGSWLRATSVDELPQLLNVIRGEMSLVGPRPHAPETAIGSLRVTDALGHYRVRERVRPGITGLAQIRGQRGPILTLANLEQRLASDLEYIERRSLGLDLLILVRSVPALFGR